MLESDSPVAERDGTGVIVSPRTFDRKQRPNLCGCLPDRRKTPILHRETIEAD
jgi:hypothetical protein